MMEPFQTCTDTSDISELSLPQQLFLKPEAKLSVTVALPQVRLPGKTISNWEVMERLKQMVRPEEFVVIRVSKSTLEFIRFDAEIENRSRLQHAIARLDGKSIKLSGFPELLKIKAAESKPDFPTRHDWDKYFRDAKNMNEMKPGERPDTVHIQNLPSKWFVSKKDRRNGIETPNEFTLQKVFEIFGEIRCVDIPMLDPYRNQMKATISGIKKFSHSTDATFEAYVQYKEYICFVKAMDALRGMKLVHRDGNKAYSASIKVDFDKTKHLSDMSIRRRKVEREKLMAKERETEELKRREEEALKQAVEEEKRRRLEEKKLKGERRKEREEKRKQRILKKLKKKEAEQMNIKIAIEERKLLMAQRKLESIRLLDELFERVKQEKQKEETRSKEAETEEENKSKKKKEKSRKRHDKDKRKKENLIDKERELRKKLVKKIKTAQEQQMEERREKLLKTIEGKNKLKSVLKAKAEGSNDEFDPYNNKSQEGYPDYDAYPEFAPYDSYRGGYNYPEWGARGYRGGSYVPRRYRGHRGGGGGGYHHYYNEWIPYRESFDGRARGSETEKKKSEEISGTEADGMEDISSDSSSATSKYSHLNSSSEEEDETADKEIKTEPGNLKPGTYDDREKGEGEGNASHPWIGYSDYYNPRFARVRGGRRPRGAYVPRRGWARGFPSHPNPNVPMNSFYMQSINSQYYKYFNKLAKGDYGDEDYRASRSRSGSGSRSSERVVCRKVLSRSRSRSRKRSYSRSRSRSSSRSERRSRSRSRSRRSRSKSKSRSRSRRRSRRRSRTGSRNRSQRSASGRRRTKSEERSESESKTRSRRSKSKTSAIGEEAAIEKKSNLKAADSNEAEAEKSASSKPNPVEKEEKDAVKSEKEKKTEDEKKNKERTEKERAKSPSKGKSEAGSDWSLSLSGSDCWSGGSPARKARPLGDPAWEPEDPDLRRRRRDRENDRGYRTIMSKVTGTFRSDNFSSYDRDRYRRPGYRFEDRPPHLRSHVARPANDLETYHSDSSTKDSKKSRHKKDKKRKRKHAAKDSDSKKRKRADS